mgnify:CR=1 FL=1
MSLAIIEINDSGHCCRNDMGEIFISPGYAFLTNDGIETGDIAMKKSFLSPQRSFNQFWRQLNLSPLSHPTNKVRHNADLAFQQLTDLYNKLNKPSEIIFAIPGTFDREQLSIILGLAKASSFKVLGLVDSAVAAVCHFGSKDKASDGKCFVHLDIQLHQTVFTRLQKNQGTLKRTCVDIVTDIGLRNFYDDWARNIADKFIKEYRFDPLHTAEGEQQLYNSLPKWIEELNLNSETIAILDSPQGTYQLVVNLEELLAGSTKKINQLKKKFISKAENSDVLVASHRLLLLPGISEKLAKFHILKKEAAVFGSLENSQEIIQDQQNMHLVISLNNLTSNIPETTNLILTKIPTHVLYKHEAIEIGNVLYFDLYQGSLRFTQSQISKKSIFLMENNLYINDEDKDQKEKVKLNLGEVITVESESFELIRVI